jgi:hypothetical protein
MNLAENGVKEYNVNHREINVTSTTIGSPMLSRSSRKNAVPRHLIKGSPFISIAATYHPSPVNLLKQRAFQAGSQDRCIRFWLERNHRSEHQTWHDQPSPLGPSVCLSDSDCGQRQEIHELNNTPVRFSSPPVDPLYLFHPPSSEHISLSLDSAGASGRNSSFSNI